MRRQGAIAFWRVDSPPLSLVVGLSYPLKVWPWRLRTVPTPLVVVHVSRRPSRAGVFMDHPSFEMRENSLSGGWSTFFQNCLSTHDRPFVGHLRVRFGGGTSRVYLAQSPPQRAQPTDALFPSSAGIRRTPALSRKNPQSAPPQSAPPAFSPYLISTGDRRDSLMLCE